MKKINLVALIFVLLTGFLLSACNLLAVINHPRSIYLLPAEHGTAVLEKTSQARVYNLSVQAEEGYRFCDKEICCAKGNGSYYDSEYVLPLTKIKENYYSFELTEEIAKLDNIFISVLFLKGTEEDSAYYHVSVDIDSYGDVSIQKGFYQPGETVELVVSPTYIGYVMEEGYPQVLKGEDQIEIKQDPKWTNKFSFIMPESDVKVAIKLTSGSSSSSDNNQKKYKIEFDQLQHGKITAETSEGIKLNESVKLTIVPDEGYKVNSKSIYVYYDGHKLCDGSYSTFYNTYSFSMPASDVHVYAEFIPE